MEFHNHDILIVGGGGAGLRAAIAIGEENPNLSVGVISKVYPMRSHTVSAEGGVAAVIKPNDSLDDHAYDTISGADWLADQDAVEALVNEAPGELIQLEHWGCPWSREPDGSVAVRSCAERNSASTSEAPRSCLQRKVVWRPAFVSNYGVASWRGEKATSSEQRVGGALSGRPNLII